MKVLILGASGFIGGVLYKSMKGNADNFVLGTHFESKKDNSFIKLDVTNFSDVNAFLLHFRADVIVWCLMGKDNEQELIDRGLPNVLDNMNPKSKFIFMSTNAVFSEGNGDFSEEYLPSYKSSTSPLALYSNAKIDGENLVRKLDNYIIIRPGAVYGKGVSGNWDKRTDKFIEELTSGRTVTKTTNLYNTFVQVNEVSDAIMKLIEMDYRGIIHLGPEKKESYFEFFRKMAKELNLDEKLILPNSMDKEQAVEDGIILDTSLNTRKCREELGIVMS